VSIVGVLLQEHYYEMLKKSARHRATNKTIAFVKDIENKTTLEGNDDRARMDCYIQFY